MAILFADRIKDTSSTTGTGTIQLGNIAAPGYRTFASSVSTGNQVYYCIDDGTNWEINLGLFTAGSPNTLTRDQLISSSTGAVIDFPVGTKSVFLVIPSTYIQTRAPLASPTFTGTVTIPTPDTGDNSTKAANTSFVRAELAALIASSPSTLDTLNEIATALGNDPNFATTMVDSLASKSTIASPTFTGTVTAPTLILDNPLAIAQGGTGQTTINAAINGLLPVQSSGKFLTTNGTNISWDVIPTQSFASISEKPTTLAGYGITDAITNTVAGRSGTVVLTSADVGLSNVNNTTDAEKPVSTAQQTALDLKANIDNPSFTGDITSAGNINLTGSATNRSIAVLSGGASNFGAVGTGRTSTELYLATASGDGAFVTNSIAGDGVLSTTTTSSLILGTNGLSAIRIGSTQNITLYGTRIQADFTNATIANRCCFQTSTPDSTTILQVIPHGTGTVSGLLCFNNSDPTNASTCSMTCDSGASIFYSSKTGTGTYLPMQLYTSGQPRITITTTGNVLIGNIVNPFGSGRFLVQDDTNTNAHSAYYNTHTGYTGTAIVTQVETGPSAAWNHFSCRSAGGVPRFTVFGNGCTIMDKGESSTVPLLQMSGQVNVNWAAIFRNLSTQAGCYGIAIQYDNLNGTGNLFLNCYDAGGNRFYIMGNGDARNTNNSYGGTSDIKLKENITDARKDYLKDINQIRLVKYSLKAEHKTEANYLGIIAQELEPIFPNLIDNVPDRDAENNDLGTTTKAIKYSIFIPILIGVAQELSTKLEQALIRITELEKKLNE